MKRNKKVISMFLVLVFFLGLFNFAFATYVSDNQITNNDKLKYLTDEKYVVGYVDGSLGLENTITRAELAALVIRALGLEEMTLSITNISTDFKDVNIYDWHSPYIAMASSKSIIKGYPDGTFKPDLGISYQEAITMMVRMVLNQQEIALVEASGKYPMNYYIKANELNLLEGVNFEDISIAAERGNVFVIFYNAINFSEKEDSFDVESLVLNKDSDNIEVVVLKDVNSFKEGDTIKIKVSESDKEKISIGKVYNIKINLKNELISFSINENVKTIKAKLTKNRNDFKLDNKTYSSDDIISIIYNNEEVTFKSLPKEINYATAIIYNGKLIYLECYNFEEILPVENVKNNRIYGITANGTIKSFNINKNVELFLFKDGNMSQLLMTKVTSL